jgi:hypothetical protein
MPWMPRKSVSPFLLCLLSVLFPSLSFPSFLPPSLPYPICCFR